MLSSNDRATVVPDREVRPCSQIESWIAEARAGSREALGLLLEGCRKYLLVMANRSLDSDLRPRTSASDLVQDAFVEVHRDFANFVGRTEGELFAWLSTILANRLANNVRRHRHTEKRTVNRETPLESPVGLEQAQICKLPEPCDAIIAQDEQRRVQFALARLSEQDRMVLRLRTWERQAFGEVGGQMNLSADSARKLWGRAVQRLERELRNFPSDT